MLVNDIGRPTSEPWTGFVDLRDYKSWRRLAVIVRRSVIAGVVAEEIDVQDGLGFLEAWATDASPTDKAQLAGMADPDIDDLRFPKVPIGAAKVLAAGGAAIFTGRVTDLAAYADRGNDLVPEGEGTYALKQARSRKPSEGGAPSSPLKVFAIGVGVSATAGLIVFAITEILKAWRGKG